MSLYIYNNHITISIMSYLKSGGEIEEAMWEPSHPNRNEDCIRVEIFDVDTFLWADWNCKQRLPYICEVGMLIGVYSTTIKLATLIINIIIPTESEM